tara:strand:- start:237 stop:395 length:159 start_codon:yes stop_codon:yes gene_type:complete
LNLYNLHICCVAVTVPPITKIIETAKKGDDIGIKISQKVRGGDKVFVVPDNE